MNIDPTGQPLIVSPGQPLDERPERNQVPPTTPTGIKNMPDPGEVDPGGNPLAEGVFASADTFDQNPYPSLYDETEFSLEGVIPHDEQSANPKKRDRVAAEKTANPLALLGLARILPMIAGGGEAAAGAGATGGLGASGMGGIMRGAMGVGQAANGAEGLGQMAGMGGGIPNPMNAIDNMIPEAPAPNVQPPSYYASFNPVGLDEIPTDTDDPEDVDTKEFNDGEKGELQSDQAIDVGGAASPEFVGEILKQVEELLPTLIDAFNNGGDPENPDILSLHESLDSEIPGYLDMGDDEEAKGLIEALMDMGGDGKNLEGDPNDPLLEDNVDPKDPVLASIHQSFQPQQGLGVDPQAFTNDPSPPPQQNRCPMCGSTISPANQGCPQCGVANGQANAQPPQQAQVAQPTAKVGSFHYFSAPTRNKQLRQIQELQDQYGPDTSEPVHEFDDGWKVHRLKNYADKVREGEMMNNCFRFPPPMSLSDLWAKHPDLGIEDPSDQMGAVIKAMELAVERGDDSGNLVPSDIDLSKELPEEVYSIRDADGIPRLNYMHGQEPLGNANQPPKPEYKQYLDQWLESQQQPHQAAFDESQWQQRSPQPEPAPGQGSLMEAVFDLPSLIDLVDSGQTSPEVAYGIASEAARLGKSDDLQLAIDDNKTRIANEFEGDTDIDYENDYDAYMEAEDEYFDNNPYFYFLSEVENAMAEIRISSTRLSEAQGPRTDEQKAAVAELLQSEGREAEIPEMLLQPWNYAEELAGIQGQDAPPEPVDPSDPAGPMNMPPPPGGDMMGMGGPPGMPPMGPPGMGGPPPGMGGPPPGMPPMMGSVQEPYSSWEEGHVAAEHGNITSEVAADQVQQRDVSKENDPSHIWSDTEDSPLKVGREYKMASPSYDIPDIIRVTAIKPESIEIKITSEFGIDSRTEISYQDVEMEGLTFEPYEHGDDQDLPEEDAIYNDSTSGDETDLTNSAQMFAKSAGYSYSQSEQRDFINEQGSARNADKLDLSNTHYRTESEDDDFLFGW